MMLALLVLLQIPFLENFVEILRPFMPFFYQILELSKLVLLPFGEFMVDGVLSPMANVVPQGPAGLAVFIGISAGIFIAAAWMNLAWRPRGYEKGDKFEERIASDGGSMASYMPGKTDGPAGPGRTYQPSPGVESQGRAYYPTGFDESPAVPGPAGAGQDDVETHPDEDEEEPGFWEGED